MDVMFTYVTKCKAIQRNQFRNDIMMPTHIVTGQFKGNRLMAQKNKMMEQRHTDQNQAIEEK